ncbi:MAG: transcriptional regulator, partial [Acidobacteria bacterium]|nr:transcriptional regulator [Acidobacteriota bacterium]
MVAVVMLLGPSVAKAEWKPVGPFGGDARSLAADPSDPNRMFLGTATGQVYFTDDAGRQWTRLAGLEVPSNWIVDHLAIDAAQPQVVYAALWSLGSGGGGVFKTTDGGRTWRTLEGIQGQSVRALALAPSRSKILVAGTLEGVFRSEDAGEHWQRISPLGHAEIHSVESVAIDPRDPQIIYAGTWHLPWKTTDGGAHWTSIKKGMVDDSDVFSIAIHPTRPNRIYATACTGIYRSDNAGADWKKIQGIPNSSRRTHTLALDPRDPEILYAGTTEGLWRTSDGGVSWHRLTAHTWVINDIHLDPSQPAHFLIAMDRAGVMESWDGGNTFREANRGYAQRQISRIVSDPSDPERFYISLLHDKEFGGVFTTNTRGATWQQLSAGLEGQDVLSLLVVKEPEWRLLAGTTEGVFEYSPERPVWKNLSRWRASSTGGAGSLGPAVRDLFQRFPGDPIYAATSEGVFESNDGREWRKLPLSPSSNGLYAVASFGVQNQNLLVATSLGLILSHDHGRSWNEIWLDGDRSIRINEIAPNPVRPSEVFAATEAGLFRSVDGGLNWSRPGRGLPVSSLYDVQV